MGHLHQRASSEDPENIYEGGKKKAVRARSQWGTRAKQNLLDIARWFYSWTHSSCGCLQKTRENPSQSPFQHGWLTCLNREVLGWWTHGGSGRATHTEYHSRLRYSEQPRFCEIANSSWVYVSLASCAHLKSKWEPAFYTVMIGITSYEYFFTLWNVYHDEEDRVHAATSSKRCQEDGKGTISHLPVPHSIFYVF